MEEQQANNGLFFLGFRLEYGRSLRLASTRKGFRFRVCRWVEGNAV